MKRSKGQRNFGNRSESGFQLVESLVAVVIGSILMLSMFSTASACYRGATRNENQILATNMAQQVIDNARNSSWTHLTVDLLGEQPSTPQNKTVSQDLTLYDYPTGNLQNAFFPRPLLRNEAAASGVNYTAESTASRFNGTVTETLTDLNLTPDDAIQVDVRVTWSDTLGPHSYSTSTRIDQYGVHNY